MPPQSSYCLKTVCISYVVLTEIVLLCGVSFISFGSREGEQQRVEGGCYVHKQRYRLPHLDSCSVRE